MRCGRLVDRAAASTLDVGSYRCFGFSLLTATSRQEVPIRRSSQGMMFRNGRVRWKAEERHSTACWPSVRCCIRASTAMPSGTVNMEFIFEIALQFLGEILLQVIFEFLAETGVHSLADTLKRPKNAVLSTIGFILWGAMAGGISLFILPHSPISNPLLRKCNVLVTPLVAGIFMMMIGRQRDKRGQTLVRLDRFSYAFAFAFAMAIVRYCWTK